MSTTFHILGLIRDNSEGLKMFSDGDGFSVLLRAMQSDVEKLKIKSAFLLSAVCSQHPAIRGTYDLFHYGMQVKCMNEKMSYSIFFLTDDLQRMGWVHQLVGLINGERTSSHEHLLSALLALVRDHHKCIEDCRDPKLQLRTVLTSYIDTVKGKDECQVIFIRNYFFPCCSIPFFLHAIFKKILKFKR